LARVFHLFIVPDPVPRIPEMPESHYQHCRILLRGSRQKVKGPRLRVDEALPAQFN
jgi:hypothetical protein